MLDILTSDTVLFVLAMVLAFWAILHFIKSDLEG